MRDQLRKVQIKKFIGFDPKNKTKNFREYQAYFHQFITRYTKDPVAVVELENGSIALHELSEMRFVEE